jgi:dephospho-CoA kinase
MDESLKCYLNKNSRITAVILAAGRGSRMGALTDNYTKCMVYVGGKPLLQWALDSLSQIEGLNKVILVVDWKKETIMSFFGTKYKGLNIKYVDAPHVPKQALEQEFHENSFGMDPEEFKMERNHLEYIEFLTMLPDIDPDFSETDFYFKLHGDILFDSESVKRIMHVLKKYKTDFTGVIYNVYSRFLIDVLRKLNENNWVGFVKFVKKYYDTPAFARSYYGQMSFYKLFSIALEHLKPESRNHLWLKQILDSNQDFLMEKDAFLPETVFMNTAELGHNLRMTQHVDTPEQLFNLRKRFKPNAGDTKTLVVFRGLPGSGKTRACSFFQKRVHLAEHFNMDTYSKEIVRDNPLAKKYSRLKGDSLIKKLKEEYSRIKADAILKRFNENNLVFFDGVLSTRIERSIIFSEIVVRGIDVVLVDLYCEPKICKERISMNPEHEVSTSEKRLEHFHFCLRNWAEINISEIKDFNLTYLRIKSDASMEKEIEEKVVKNFV